MKKEILVFKEVELDLEEGASQQDAIDAAVSKFIDEGLGMISETEVELNGDNEYVVTITETEVELDSDNEYVVTITVETEE